MKLKLVKLNFTSPLHIGSGKPDHYDKSESVLHSDTIKSAVFSTSLLFENNLGEDFFKSFTVSSAFPFLDDKLFFPVPDLPGDLLYKKFNLKFDCEDEEKTDYDKGKIIKKIKFLEKDLYEKFISGEVIDVEIREKNKDYQQLVSGYLLSKFVRVKDFKISKSEVQQRVYVSRMSEVLASEDENPKFSEPYYVDKIYFQENAGLYFLLDADDGSFETIEKSLNLLEDFGFGTDRNIGNGQFTCEIINDFELKLPEEANLKTNLSLYIPADKELDKLKNIVDIEAKMFYSLMERGGYISNFLDQEYGTLLKNPVMMFGENSVFPNIDLKGKVVEVTPDKLERHKVWRDGTSVFIPIKS